MSSLKKGGIVALLAACPCKAPLLISSGIGAISTPSATSSALYKLQDADFLPKTQGYWEVAAKQNLCGKIADTIGINPDVVHYGTMSLTALALGVTVYYVGKWAYHCQDHKQ